MLLTLCLVAFKPQAWSSSTKLWGEGRIPGASSCCLARLRSALAWSQGSAGAGVGKSPLERFPLVRGEGGSNALAEGWRRHGLKWQHGLLPAADVLAAFDSSYRHVWFNVGLLLR